MQVNIQYIDNLFEKLFSWHLNFIREARTTPKIQLFFNIAFHSPAE